MKNFLFLLRTFLAITIFLVFINPSNSQIEVRSSSLNSVLDINSTNKAVLLPRIDNTDLVASPVEGLFVYNKSTKSPSYHDGVQWNDLASMMMPMTTGIDSLTYTVITGYGPAIPTGTKGLSSFAISGTDGSGSTILNFSKPRDSNTIGFLSIFNNQITTNSISIEVKVYIKGETSPYFAYKLTDLHILAYNMGNTTDTNSPGESYSILANIFGYNDITTGTSYAYNQTTNTEVPY